MYAFFISHITVILQIVMAVYFLFILLFSDRNRIHAIIIFLAAFMSYLSYSEPQFLTPLSEYIYYVEVSIMWDGITAFILTMFMLFDRIAVKQALLLIFAVLCHCVLIYDLTIASSALSNFVYNIYDELIITIGILQMVASYNGFTNAFSNVQEFVFRAWLYSNRLNQNLFTRKERGGKA